MWLYKGEGDRKKECLMMKINHHLASLPYLISAF